MIAPLLVAAILAASPEKGEVAPDFTATTTDGQAVTLSELVKERTVIVSFFPRAFTPG